MLEIQALKPNLVIFFNWIGAGDEMSRWCEENKIPEIEIDIAYGKNAWFYGVNAPKVGQLGGKKMERKALSVTG